MSGKIRLRSGSQDAGVVTPRLQQAPHVAGSHSVKRRLGMRKSRSCYFILLIIIVGAVSLIPSVFITHVKHVPVVTKTTPPQVPNTPQIVPASIENAGNQQHGIPHIAKAQNKHSLRPNTDSVVHRNTNIDTSESMEREMSNSMEQEEVKQGQRKERSDGGTLTTIETVKATTQTTHADAQNAIGTGDDELPAAMQEKYVTNDSIDKDGYVSVKPPSPSHDWRFFFTDVIYQEELNNIRFLSFQNYTFRQDTPGDFRMREGSEYDFDAYITERLVDVRLLNYYLQLPDGDQVKCIAHLNVIALGAWYVNRRIGIIDCPITSDRMKAFQIDDSYSIKLHMEVIDNTEFVHRERESDEYTKLASLETRYGHKHGAAVQYYTYFDKWLTDTAKQVIKGRTMHPERYEWKAMFRIPIESRSAGHLEFNTRYQYRPTQGHGDSANEATITSRKPGVSVCVTMTNYNRYTEEIMEYYKVIGVSHVYIGFNRRISMKRKINSQADRKGFPFLPTKLDVRKTSEALEPLIREGLVSVIGRRVMEKLPRKATSAGVEKIMFWNSCLAHATGHGDEYVVINDLDELPVFNRTFASNITEFIDKSLKSNRNPLKQSFYDPRTCAIQLTRRDAVQGFGESRVEQIIHTEDTLGARFPMRLFNSIQLYQRKIPILPKMIVHKSATSVSFHHAQCATYKEYARIEVVPESQGLFLHFSNMFTERTLKGKYVAERREYNLYHTQWYQTVLKSICKRKTKYVDSETCAYALNPALRPKMLREVH